MPEFPDIDTVLCRKKLAPNLTPPERYFFNVKILVIEDERSAASHLANGLRESGYEVEIASDGIAALAAFGASKYGLVLCDVMMPGDDGFAIVATLRKLAKEIPVIFVTALDDVGSKVRGLDLGADDYLVKPFAFAELLARIRALKRRETLEQKLTVLTIADLELDLRSHCIRRGDKTIELTTKEFTLLWLLVERAGEVVSRRVIAEKVWGMDFDSGTNIIDVQVKRLRAKIELPDAPPLIQTVRGTGYRIDQSR